MKKIAFTIYDDQNKGLAQNMINSLRKFHSEEELPIYEVCGEELQKYLKDDPAFFYRATPIIAKKLFEDGYDFVLKLDADQIIMGDLSYLWSDYHNFDAGVVLNINRVDPPKYGFVSLLTIPPNRYFNNGLVALRSSSFVDHWYELCMSHHFSSMPMREQGFLNILCHYGRYKVTCLDDYDVLNGYYSWHGLVAKGETVNAFVKDGEVIIPKGSDNYPDRDIKLKVFHFAGGGNEPRNYRIWFNEEVQRHIGELISDGK